MSSRRRGTDVEGDREGNIGRGRSGRHIYVSPRNCKIRGGRIRMAPSSRRRVNPTLPWAIFKILSHPSYTGMLLLCRRASAVASANMYITFLLGLSNPNPQWRDSRRPQTNTSHWLRRGFSFMGEPICPKA